MPECSFLSCWGYREGQEMDEDPLMLQPTWTVTTIVIELPGLVMAGIFCSWSHCIMVEACKFEEQCPFCCIF